MHPRHDRKHGASRLSALGVAAAATAVIALLLWYAVYALQSTAPQDDTRATVEKRRTPTESKPLVSNAGAKVPETVVLDLEGQREPTEEETIRQAIEDLLARMRTIAPNETERLLAFKKNEEDLAALLRSLPPSAAPIIKELLWKESDFVLRRRLYDSLAAMGTEDAAAVIRDYFLAHAQEQGLGSELRHVISALGASDTQTGYDALVDFLGSQEPNMRALRPAYVEALGKHRQGIQAVPIFLDLMANDTVFEVRNLSAQAVKNVAKREPARCQSVLPDLMRNFEAEKLVPVKQTTLGAIGQIGDASSLPFITGVGTSSQSLDVRLSAAAAASRIGGEEALKTLREIYANEPEKKVLVNALAQVPTASSVQFLHDLAASSQTPTERIQAIKALVRIDAPGVENALLSLVAAESDPTVRAEAEKAVQAVARKGAKR